MTPNATPPRHPRSGSADPTPVFTMVEMLTVIGIIVILMAILLPVVGKMRSRPTSPPPGSRSARSAQAIEQYYLEYKVYPGPVSNVAITQQQGPVPRDDDDREHGPRPVRRIARCRASNVIYDSNDLASNLGPVNLNPNPMLKQTRHTPPFIDATPGQNMPAPAVGQRQRENRGQRLDIPEFLDQFPPQFGNGSRPILYMRAVNGNPASPNPTASTPTICGSDDTTTQYNYTHLMPYAIANLDFKMNGQTPVDQHNNPISDASYYANWNLYLQQPQHGQLPSRERHLHPDQRRPGRHLWDDR